LGAGFRFPAYHCVQEAVYAPGVDLFPLFLAHAQRPVPERLVFLESLGTPDAGRYSILGTGALLGLESRAGQVRAHAPGQEQCAPADLFAAMRQFVAAQQGAVRHAADPHFQGGLVGYWGYDLALLQAGLSPKPRPPAGLPDAAFFLPATVMVQDRQEGIIHVYAFFAQRSERGGAVQRVAQAMDAIRGGSPGGPAALPPVPGPPVEEGFEANTSREEFTAMVRRAQEHIRIGDAFQVVLSQRWQRSTAAHPSQVYACLRDINPSPYMFYLRFPGFVLTGSSPEMLVRVQGERVETRPIAGTRPWTGDPARDALLREELLADPKERAEHLMLVDLGRNDIGRVSRPGSVSVPEFMQVEPYSHVVHLVSLVRGRLNPGEDALSALCSCYPAGTLTGAPKRRAMEIIDGLEKDRRGPYGGAVGYLGVNGDLDTCITIRSLLFRGGRCFLQAGAGIVADSHPAREYEETLSKARALMAAVHRAEGRA
jgi:anthranilate synthase component 1